MIPLDKKRDVFILWFIKRHTKREISRKVNAMSLKIFMLNFLISPIWMK